MRVSWVLHGLWCKMISVSALVSTLVWWMGALSLMHGCVLHLSIVREACDLVSCIKLLNFLRYIPLRLCTKGATNIYSGTNHKSSFTLWFRIKNGNGTRQFGCSCMCLRDSRIGAKLLGVWSFVEGAELQHYILICDVFYYCRQIYHCNKHGKYIHSALFLMQHTGVCSSR